MRWVVFVSEGSIWW